MGAAFTEAELGERPPASGSGRRGSGDAPQLRRLLRQLREQQHGRQGAFSVVVIAELPVLGASATEQARRYLQLEALGLPLRLADGGDPDRALIAAWQRRGDDERRRERVRDGDAPPPRCAVRRWGGRRTATASSSTACSRSRTRPR